MSHYYLASLDKQLEESNEYRRVLYTGKKSQLVIMQIQPGDDIGEEVHDYVEQVLYMQSGFGKAVLNGEVIEFEAGAVFVVEPGTKHNFINTGTDVLEIATVYSPANHIDGRVHVSHADAIADEADEAFGHAQR